jgi:acyl-CoA synthetase (AMP-forming)/AMP-acid ligase II
LNVSGKLAWDFEELDRHVHALSAGLLDMGVKKGDRVAVIMGNCRFVAHIRRLS